MPAEGKEMRLLLGPELGGLCPAGSQGPGQHAAVPDSLLRQPPLPDPRLRLGERGRRGESQAGESWPSTQQGGVPAGKGIRCQKTVKSNDDSVIKPYV